MGNFKLFESHFWCDLFGMKLWISFFFLFQTHLYKFHNKSLKNLFMLIMHQDSWITFPERFQIILMHFMVYGSAHKLRKFKSWQLNCSLSSVWNCLRTLKSRGASSPHNKYITIKDKIISKCIPRTTYLNLKYKSSTDMSRSKLFNTSINPNARCGWPKFKDSQTVAQIQISEKP